MKMSDVTITANIKFDDKEYEVQCTSTKDEVEKSFGFIGRQIAYFIDPEKLDRELEAFIKELEK